MRTGPRARIVALVILTALLTTTATAGVRNFLHVGKSWDGYTTIKRTFVVNDEGPKVLPTEAGLYVERRGTLHPPAGTQGNSYPAIIVCDPDVATRCYDLVNEQQITLVAYIEIGPDGGSFRVQVHRFKAVR